MLYMVIHGCNWKYGVDVGWVGGKENRGSSLLGRRARTGGRGVAAEEVGRRQGSLRGHPGVGRKSFLLTNRIKDKNTTSFVTQFCPKNAFLGQNGSFLAITF